MAKTLTIFLAADVSKLNRQLKGAQNDLNIFSDGIGGVAGKLTNLMGPALIGAAAAAGAFAVKLGVDGVQAALEDAAALDKLAQTLDNLNMAHKLPEVENAISKFERTLGIADTELRPAFDRLVRSIGDTDEATRILGIALDTSAGTGKDLRAVTEALGKAYDGNTAGLARLGAGIDAATLRSGDLDAITNKLATTFGGQARTSAETLSGQIKVLQTAAENATEAFGRGLINALGDTNSQSTELVTTLADLEPALEELGGSVTEAALGLLDIAKALFEANKRGNEFIDRFGPLRTVVDQVTKQLNPFQRAAELADFALENLGLTAQDVPQGLSGTVAAALATSTAMNKAALSTAGLNDELSAVAGKPSNAFYSALAQMNKGAVESNYSLDRFDKTVEAVGGSSRTAAAGIDTMSTSQANATTVIDAVMSAVGNLNQKFRDQTAELGTARDAIKTYASTLSAEITRGFNLGAGFTMENGEVDAGAWLAGVDSEVAKYEWYGNVLAAVQRDAGSNGEALRAYLVSQGIDDGAAMGQAMLDQGLVATMGEKLAGVVAKANEVSQSMVPEFMKAGKDSANEFINGASEQLSTDTDRLKKIGKNIGKPIGANIKAEIAEAVAEAIRDAEAAGTAARAEVAAREAGRQATLTEQATAQSLARLIRNSDSRAGRDVQPVLA